MMGITSVEARRCLLSLARRSSVIEPVVPNLTTLVGKTFRGGGSALEVVRKATGQRRDKAVNTLANILLHVAIVAVVLSTGSA